MDTLPSLQDLLSWLDLPEPGLGLACAGFACIVLVGALAAWLIPRDARARTSRSPPSLRRPNPEQAGWGEATVPRAVLRIQYRDRAGAVTERTIRPIAIRGPAAGRRRVHPEAVHALCELRHATRTFRYAGIVWAMDPRSGEFIEDLYFYLGSAQPGGAPGRNYAYAGASRRA